MSHRQLEMNKIGSGKLDPKYFQSHSPQSMTSTGGNYLDSISLKLQQQQLSQGTNQGLGSGSSNAALKYNLVQSAATGNGASVRLNKQLVTQPIPSGAGQTINPNTISSKSTPSLASAYFPSS